MSRRKPASDSQGVPHRKPFAWLVLLGICCSLAGMVRAWSDVSAAEASKPAPRASASVAADTVPSASPTPVVTQMPPPASTATLVAGAVATPTPSPVEAPVQSQELAYPQQTVEGVGALPAATVRPPVGLTCDNAKSAQLIDLMNGARLQQGLSALDRDRDLDGVAFSRAENLIQNGYFDHYSADGESAFSELAARGIRYRLAGENLARNNYADGQTVEAAFDALMASEGHRANILEPRFSSVGVAAVLSGHMWIYVTVFLN